MGETGDSSNSKEISHQKAPTPIEKWEDNARATRGRLAVQSHKAWYSNRLRSEMGHKVLLRASLFRRIYPSKEGAVYNFCSFSMSKNEGKGDVCYTRTLFDGKSRRKKKALSPAKFDQTTWQAERIFHHAILIPSANSHMRESKKNLSVLPFIHFLCFKKE